jgi:hypothetical protein
MLRLRMTKHQSTGTNGVGVSEWEVFGLRAGEAVAAPKSDKAALLNALVAAANVDRGMWTADTLAALDASVDAALLVMADGDAAQADADGMVAGINGAIGGLYGLPRVVVDGPAEIFLSDVTAEYTFSMLFMPEKVSALTLTVAVEDAFFFGQSLNAVNNWGILAQTDWERDASGSFWLKTLTFTKAGGATSADEEFFVMVLENRFADGTTSVAISDVTAATPGAASLIAITNDAVTESIVYSIFDVNRDGKVDLADVAAAAYFFMASEEGANWEIPMSFPTGVEGESVSISPKRCDVNKDGAVDINDLILILVNM